MGVIRGPVVPKGAILILSYLNSGENTKLKTYAIVKNSLKSLRALRDHYL